MALERSDDGKIYGTCPVLLQRDTEIIVGHQPPFVGIMVAEFEGERYVEKPESWWAIKGFTVTDPPILEEARCLVRTKRVERTVPILIGPSIV